MKGESEYETFRSVASADLLNVDRPEVRLKEVGVLYMEHLPCEVMEARLL